MARHHHLRVDTAKQSCIHMYCQHNSPITSTPSTNKIYQYGLCNNETLDNLWCHISTVCGNTSWYTRQVYKCALESCKLQNIIMHPGSCNMIDVAIKNLCNCQVTCKDTTAADDIFGTNLGAFERKNYMAFKPPRGNKQ